MDAPTLARAYHTITKTLGELGIPDAKFSVTDTTVLFQNGFYAGRKLVYGSVTVLLLSGSDKIEFRGEDGRLLRVASISQAAAQRGKAA